MPVKLFVGNLAQSVTNEMLIEMFSEYGNVVEADALGKFGFVHMETQDEAEAAIAGLNGHEVENIAIKVEISQGGKKDKGRNDRGPVTSCKLFVGNLNESITSDDLRDLFSQHGTVKEADAKGKYGFVHMSTEEEAEKCLSELKGAYIGDVAINVEISEDKKKSGSGRDDRGRRGRANDGPVKLFIGNMSEKIQSEDLRRLFSRAGDVVECTAKGRYGFVHMASWDEAQNAIRLCNRQSLKGQTLNVEESSGGGGGGGGGGRDGRRGDGYGGRGGGYGGGRDFGYDDFPPYGGRRGGGGGGPTGDPVKIFVGNLTERTTTEDLVSLFSRYGRVIERDSQACGKFGFIHMPYMEDAERAIYELNGYHLHGVRLNVQFSQKGEKGGGPDRRRGFSRHDERPYDRPPRGMEPAPRQAMAVADYYQRTGRAPPQDDRMDRSLPPRDSYSSMYERERLAYDAYREVMARTDPYRDPYSRPTAEYRTTVDPYVRPPPESYGAKRYDEYDRSREREAPAAAPVAQAPAASAERYALTPEAAYAISRFAEVDRYRAAAGYATDPSATAATVARTANGSGDPYATAAAAGYTTSATAYPTYNTYAR